MKKKLVAAPEGIRQNARHRYANVIKEIKIFRKYEATPTGRRSI
jgi:hypothetical protein